MKSNTLNISHFDYPVPGRDTMAMVKSMLGRWVLSFLHCALGKEIEINEIISGRIWKGVNCEESSQIAKYWNCQAEIVGFFLLVNVELLIIYPFPKASLEVFIKLVVKRWCWCLTKNRWHLLCHTVVKRKEHRIAWKPK